MIVGRERRDSTVACSGPTVSYPGSGISCQSSLRQRRGASRRPLRSSFALAEEEINDPAAADVRPWTAAVFQDGGVGAAGVFEGVGEKGKAVEGMLVVDTSRQADNRCGEPTWFNRYDVAWLRYSMCLNQIALVSREFFNQQTFFPL